MKAFGLLLSGGFALLFAALAALQLLHKGPPLNNSYLFAGPRQRREMDLRPLYRQSAAVFSLLALLFLCLLLWVTTGRPALIAAVWLLAGAAAVFAVWSSVREVLK